MSDKYIVVEGARQNNLKNLDLRIPLNELTVVTGVSGSGKSSLAFDTIYSEGQRRYVETFSPYARQFLERMDKPQVDRIEGIPPAIAIDQTNPVRTSRSTVGTMTELNDHLKLLFARAAHLHCSSCGAPVRRDDPESIGSELLSVARSDKTIAYAIVTFPVAVPDNFAKAEILGILEKQGYTRIWKERKGALDVVQDRIKVSSRSRSRVVEAVETALTHGQGYVTAFLLSDTRKTIETMRFSTDLHCAECDIHYSDPTPNWFSFNSPAGACDDCRGFGRVIGIDFDLVVPDATRTLAEGAVKIFQSKSYIECQDHMMQFAEVRGIPVDVPWHELSDDDRTWVLEGEGEWTDHIWYGVRRFFAWLEGRAYKMHIRVLLSRYRSYSKCGACEGARLKPEPLLWRVGHNVIRDDLPGLNVHQLMLLPIEHCHRFFQDIDLRTDHDEATDMLLDEIRLRINYLVDVGLGYLTLDRQSRTLSGGEVQRINLTTALGTSLVNSLFVLDEPSIGLHPRDVQRLIRVLHRLRDAGNTLLVVEHDADVIRASDRVLDLGPGPGEHGGDIVFFGTRNDLLLAPDSLTAEYLRGERLVTDGDDSAPQRVDAKTPRLRILGAAEHNLKTIDVDLPLNRLVCITGVSGSGKSTVLQDVCYNALRKLQGKPVDPPGAHREIIGHELIDTVVLVDQSAIGKTARSNPASYVGALDAIRKLFAKAPLSRERGYQPGTFSFNSGAGRCPTCSGNGFEHIEMQFLSDVYLRCTECDGKRYRDEVLEVTIFGDEDGKSIADVLELTVSEACEYFAAHKDILRVLSPLNAVGLGYVKLGQPVPTLSGGEAQRLKLAGHLAQSSGKKPTLGSLFLFDEPTTGLHFDDVATLLKALRQLLAKGHSVVVIEHHLDIMKAADWIIDLGPEGGNAGGEIVCAGPPKAVAACKGSHTGAALLQAGLGAIKKYSSVMARRQTSQVMAEAPAPYTVDDHNMIRIHNAREHNLQNIDIDIPRDTFTVITGISGSGKSTIAFDILFGEGQRRYLESLNAYARQFVQPASRPDVDAIYGIPPTVAIEQRTSRGGIKSTVATVTEIYHFLRLLFVKLGTQHCPDCDVPIEPQSREMIVSRILKEYRNDKIQILAPLIVARKGYYTDLAAWAERNGYKNLRVDGKLLPTDDWPRLDRYKEHDIELPVGDYKVETRQRSKLNKLLDTALHHGKGVVYVLPKGRGRSAAKPVIFSTVNACRQCGRSFEALDPRLFSFNSKHGWCRSCFGTGLYLPEFEEELTGEERQWRQQQADADTEFCGACDGRRLRPEALSVRFAGRSIDAFTDLSVGDAETACADLVLDKRGQTIARDVLAELQSRLAFLVHVGLPYLSLDRAAPTLSGGEAQRIRLAAQLGSNLRGVCYILDEPTIGLHARDNMMLLDTLHQLKEKGNTVVVVEHDEDTIRRADHILDIGPGAGVNGGHVVATGTVSQLKRNKHSITGKFLRRPLRHPLVVTERRTASIATATCLKIQGAHLHNLRKVNLRIPLGRLVCVTGVSGSGKSTLVRHVLQGNLHAILHHEREARKKKKRKAAAPKLIGCRTLEGTDLIDRVLEVDQTPIGKTPRSCPATYVKIWDRIRRLFAETPDARMRGYTPSRFSFNVEQGRCPECGGQGMQRIEMSFLPDVTVLCETCSGKRFTPETLSIQFKDKTVAEVLGMSIDNAVEFFSAHEQIHHALQLMQDVGLGYLTLGQQSPTLSGGEAQRIKLVTELAKAGGRTAGHTLYVLDEPTIGLHMADVEKLIHVLHRLVDAGNTVILIEHNLDMIAEADWLIDLGPEGGDEGGEIIAQGPPEKVAEQTKRSHTAQFLKPFLKERKAHS
jgi:excinuclease ABC subunit A